MPDSQISGFYKKTLDDRRKFVKEFAGLSDEDMNVISNTGAIDEGLIDRMIENVIGTFDLPLGVAVNFLVNGKDYIVPMAIEEPSVVAAASNLAKIARVKGGFHCTMTEPVMISQIQLVDVADPFASKMKIMEHKDEILKLANEQDPILIKFGGGARDLEVRVLDSRSGPMVVTHLHVDTRDAMGANAVNTMAEAVAPLIERITGGRVYLRILSNLADRRLVRVRAVFDKEKLGGEEVVDGMIAAYHFADADPYRAATHNKGIMNGIISVVRATGNDTRAVEAGAHSYASRNGKYGSLTTYEKDTDGNLVGTLEMPMPVGLIGGATAVHPVAKACVKILGVKTAAELSHITGAVGLAQNAAAMKALATEGISRGHMSLHARNIAVMAGAKTEEIDMVVEELVKSGKVRMDKASEILKKIRGE